MFTWVCPRPPPPHNSQESGARGLWELAMLRPFPKHIFDKDVLQLLVNALTHSPCARAVHMALGAVWALLPYQGAFVSPYSIMVKCLEPLERHAVD